MHLYKTTRSANDESIIALVRGEYQNQTKNDDSSETSENQDSYDLSATDREDLCGMREGRVTQEIYSNKM